MGFMTGRLSRIMSKDILTYCNLLILTKST